MLSSMFLGSGATSLGFTGCFAMALDFLGGAAAAGCRGGTILTGLMSCDDDEDDGDGPEGAACDADVVERRALPLPFAAQPARTAALVDVEAQGRLMLCAVLS